MSWTIVAVCLLGIALIVLAGRLRRRAAPPPSEAERAAGPASAGDRERGG